METIAIVLDILLVIAAIAAYLARPRIGDKQAKLNSKTKSLLSSGREREHPILGNLLSIYVTNSLQATS